MIDERYTILGKPASCNPFIDFHDDWHLDEQVTRDPQNALI